MGNVAQGLPDFLLNSELHYSLRCFRPVFFPSFSRAQSCMVLEGSQSLLVPSPFSLTGTFPNKFPAYSSRFGFCFLENTPHDVLPPNQTFPTISCLLPFAFTPLKFTLRKYDLILVIWGYFSQSRLHIEIFVFVG